MPYKLGTKLEFLRGRMPAEWH